MDHTQWVVVEYLKMECHLTFLLYYYSMYSMYDLLANNFTDNYIEIVDLMWRFNYNSCNHSTEHKN